MAAADPLEEAERRLAARDYRVAHALALEAMPTDPARAHFILGIVAIDHGNAARAAELFGRAAALAPGIARHHAQLARALLALNRRDEALAAAEQGLARGPADALTFDTLGVVLTRLGRHEAAIELFERAVARHPKVASFWYNLAASRQFMGRFEAAAVAYRRTLDLDPTQARAWSALTGLKRQTSADNAAPQLEALFERTGDADGQLQLGHALAKTFEDLGEWDRSLEWLQRAKQARRDALAHDPAADAALVDAAIETRWPTARGDPSRRPIFVVGLPRTGTTLVDRILSSHRDVVSIGEQTAFSLAAKRLAGTASNLVLDAETLKACAALDPARLGSDYLAATEGLATAPRAVDKMPLNVFHAGLIHAALPNAVVVCLRRHPMDAALSNYRQLFATQFSYYAYAYDLAHTAAYVAGFERLTAHWRATLPPDRYVEVSYEALVADQERETRLLLAACGLDWDAACLSFQDNAAPVATASSVQVRQPLYRTSIGRWRRYGAGLEPLRRALSGFGLPVD